MLISFGKTSVVPVSNDSIGQMEVLSPMLLVGGVTEGGVNSAIVKHDCSLGLEGDGKGVVSSAATGLDIWSSFGLVLRSCDK